MGLFSKLSGDPSKIRSAYLDEISARPLVISSANPDKVREIVSILVAPGVDLRPRPPEMPEVEESGDSFLANAKLKAQAAVHFCGEAALGEDTGLEIGSLGGLPGVKTARFAGDSATDAENIAKLLAEIEGKDREARFITVVVVSFPDGHELVAEGETHGRISVEPRGTNGFGYDSIFVPNEQDGRTYAELNPEEKHVISHRGRALRKLVTELNGYLLT